MSSGASGMGALHKSHRITRILISLSSLAAFSFQILIVVFVNNIIVNYLMGLDG
jgi:hypothetical protein